GRTRENCAELRIRPSRWRSCSQDAVILACRYAGTGSGHASAGGMTSVVGGAVTEYGWRREDAEGLTRECTMKHTVTRAVTVTVRLTGAARAAVGSGMSTAGPDERGKGLSSTTCTAAEVQKRHDDLAQAVENEDVEAVEGVLGKVDKPMGAILTAKQFDRAAE